MTENNAAQAAEQDPLSDEYVNAVIQRHGYQSPETVIARLHQWIGRNGGENGVTLLMYEAHKVLSALRAPVADEDNQPTAPDDDAIAECWVTASDCDGIAYDGPSFERGYRLGEIAERDRAALASAAVADESPMAKAAEALREKARQERQAYQDRREADRVASAPVAGEAHAVAVVEVSVPHLRSISVKIIPDAPMPNAGDLLYAAPQASEAVRMEDLKAIAREVAADSAAIRAEARNAALEEAAQTAYKALFPTNDRSDWTEFAESASFGAKYAAQCIRALKSQSAALSAQPRAQKGGNDAD